ncbi:MAG: preprotein translocase subunit YajC [Proteobacteria bacterium]|nr:preprotein translocase subunit YajC [Pseudomonadota bacterium]
MGIAYAMGAGAQTGNPQGGGAFFVPLILMFVIFYFLLIRPQQKKAKEVQQMISSLKKGDRVVTNGGVYGRISGLDENTITLEIADKVKIKVLRSAVASLDAQANGA